MRQTVPKFFFVSFVCYLTENSIEFDWREREFQTKYITKSDEIFVVSAHILPWIGSFGRAPLNSHTKPSAKGWLAQIFFTNRLHTNRITHRRVLEPTTFLLKLTGKNNHQTHSFYYQNQKPRYHVSTTTHFLLRFSLCLFICPNWNDVAQLRDVRRNSTKIQVKLTWNCQRICVTMHSIEHIPLHAMESIIVKRHRISTV